MSGSDRENLRSDDVFEMVVALCEGPIAGLANGDKDVYLESTPLLGPSGDNNFVDLEHTFFTGEDLAAKVVPKLGGSAAGISVGVPLSALVPVVRQTTLITGMDSIELRFNVQALYTQSGSAVKAHRLALKVEIKKSTDTAWENFSDRGDILIYGKTTSVFVKEISRDVDNTPGVAYDIRVTQLTRPVDKPNNSLKVVATVQWESIQQIVTKTNAYNNTAISQLSGRATNQIRSTPRLYLDLDGRVVQIPSNYDPIARTYTGVWDGLFNLGFTNNPAFILQDFILNSTYGVAKYYDSVTINKYDIYEAAQWCDTMVTNPDGSQSPRYTLNYLIQNPVTGQALARFIAGTFNAVLANDETGNFALKVDKSDPALHLFTIENVLDGEFSYTYTDITARYNDITVKFINPDLNWNQDQRRVFDQASIDKLGRIPHDFIAIGCTNVNEALRRAQYKLITSQTETETVSFRTNRLGQFVQLFDIILVSDPYSGWGLSGRISGVDATGKILSLRDELYLEPGQTYTLLVDMSDGSQETRNLVLTETGYVKTLYLDVALSLANLPEFAVFSVQGGTNAGLAKPFRVISKTEIEGTADIYAIQAIEVNRNKWNDADTLTLSPVVNNSAIQDPTNPLAPTNVSFIESFNKTTSQFELIVSYTLDRRAYSYYPEASPVEVWSQEATLGGEWIKRTLIDEKIILNHPPGDYNFKVLGKSILGGTTAPDSVTAIPYTITDPLDPPASVDWVIRNDKEVVWGYATPPDDFAGFLLRYHNEAGKTTWGDAIPAHQGILSNTNMYTNQLPPSAKVVLIKAVDIFGVESLEAKHTDVLTTITDPRYANTGEIISLSNDYSGTLTGGTLTGTSYVYPVDLSNSIYPADLSQDVYSKINNGTISADLSSDPSMYPTNLEDSFYPTPLTDPMYSQAFYTKMIYQDQVTTTTEGLVSFNMTGTLGIFKVEWKASTDTHWKPISSATYWTVGTYDIRCTFEGGATQVQISDMHIAILVENITELVEDYAVSSAAETTIPLTNVFKYVKSVSVVIQEDAGNAFTYNVTSKLPPKIKLYTQAGALTTGVVDVTVTGY